MPRLLLLLPTATYRATAFVEAARRLSVDLTVASEQPSTFAQAQPDRLLTLDFRLPEQAAAQARALDRKSTRLNSSHGYISYAVFCLKKKQIGPLRPHRHPTSRRYVQEGSPDYGSRLG